MNLLTDKVVLITGGSRGIGATIVKEMANHGAHVAFTYNSSPDKAEIVVSEAEASGQKIKAYKSNAADFDEAEKLISQVTEDFGKIDILINNAGITKDTLLLRMGEEAWDKVIDINLKSVFNLTKHALRGMLKQRSGSIINMSSIVGVMGNAGQSNYAASKAGIIGFTKSIAKEVGSRGIRCNAIAPGFIATEMTDVLTEEQRKAYEDNIPMKKLGQGTDVANACVFLGSDMSGYISGQVLNVCGALLT